MRMEERVKIYPDLLNNPDGDPRIYQQQYEDWHREQEEHTPEKGEEVEGGSGGSCFHYTHK